MDAEQILNTASAIAATQGGGSQTRTSSATTPINVANATKQLSVAKTPNRLSFTAVGDTITYFFEVTNTGNVTWPGPPTITDALVTDAGGTVSCPAGTIAPNAAVICTADYTVIQDDVDAGDVVNLAIANITVGGQSASGSDDVTLPALQSTGLTLVKQLNPASATTYDAPGTALIYDYVLTNTGNVTLTAPRITDDRITATCTATEIAPGTSVTCTSDNYLTTQLDIDAGSVTNIATATADDPDAAEVTTAAAQVTVDADQMPELTLDKQAPTVAPVDFFEGQTITYTYEIRNTGNTTFTGPITVTDDRITGPIDCGSADLAVNGVRTCQATYTVTAADEDLGFVTNSATASDGTTTSNADTETVPQAGTDALELTKVADLASVSSLDRKSVV